ncbi:hypothetical protein Tco_1481523, partial [Tanacetum coccineum]
TTTDPKKKDSTSGSSKGTKSQPRSSGKSIQSEEPMFEVADSDIDFSAFIMNGGDYPFDLSKPLPLITRGKRQRVPFEFFINNDLKYLQGGISTMTYMTSTTKTKVAQYDLPGIEDMVPNIWSLVKRYAIKGRCVFDKAYSRSHSCLGNEEILIWNRLNNLSSDDVADFVIALRMYTRSLVIQKRVEDLQLGVESYQKKINITKPDTTKSDIRKRHPYTPYKDPQGFFSRRLGRTG